MISVHSDDVASLHFAIATNSYSYANDDYISQGRAHRTCGSRAGVQSWVIIDRGLMSVRHSCVPLGEKSGARGRSGAFVSNQALGFDQPSGLTDERLLSPARLLSNLFVRFRVWEPNRRRRVLATPTPCIFSAESGEGV
ncbi:hypothetical protein SPHV1_370074 [Novosphingobium sp. KN65.2]|nr:hypothetical protein SPHV1_370074 [Novosphingobium sp. KN65.2]